MNDMTQVGKTRAPRAKKTAAPAAEAAAADTPIAAAILPSAPQPIALDRLRRAPENVRHTRIDEDVEGLADDIAAHGLLSSMIGYAGEWPEDKGKVFIVGGGRRLQALEILVVRGMIGADFTVPVLIRAAEEAVELSLSENLQQRNMSPVDEFFAFKGLMDNGTNSPAGLAKRFGFSERVVKQRLRLAELAPEILDALAKRDITLDAAMAYASSQNRDLQAQVFKTHRKAPYEAHNPARVRRDLSGKGMDTGNPVFTFVTAEIYEREGGGYEDDLFNESGAERVLLNPSLVEAKANEMIDFQMLRRLRDFQEDPALSLTIDGYVKVPDLRLQSWGTQAKFKLPAGFAQVEKWDFAAVWKTIRNNRIPVKVCVGINGEGELIVWPKIVFVPQDQKNAVDPRVPPPSGYRPPSQEEVDAQRRAEGIKTWSRRLAIGAFSGTPLDGRAYWPEAYEDRHTRTKVEGTLGYLVPIKVFVSDQHIAEQLPHAGERYDQSLIECAAALAAKKAAEEEAEATAAAREAELRAMEPPAVVLIDGDAWARTEDGAYAVIGEEEESFVDDWSTLLDQYSIDDIEATYPTRAEFDVAMSGAGNPDTPDLDAQGATK